MVIDLGLDGDKGLESGLVVERHDVRRPEYFGEVRGLNSA